MRSIKTQNLSQAVFRKQKLLRVTLGEKVVQDFTIMKKISGAFLVWIGLTSGFAQTMDPIPMISFTPITVNLTFPQYRALTTDGGVMMMEGGVKGIILYRENETTFKAYERNCPYMPSEACADVEIDLSRLFLLDRCCGSVFNLSDGNVSKGPASWPLRQYRVKVEGRVLTITDETF
jgi:nitrite reductase/ring-hydroxylating ferredoxin subunit